MSTHECEQNANSGEQVETQHVADELLTLESSVLSTVKEDTTGQAAKDWWFHARNLNELSGNAISKLHRIENAYAPGVLATTTRLMKTPMRDEQHHFTIWSRAGTSAGIRGNSVPFSDRSDLPQTPFGLGCVLVCIQGYLAGLSLRADRVTHTLLTVLGPEKFTNLARECAKTKHPKKISRYGRPRKAVEDSEGATADDKSGADPEPTSDDAGNRPVQSGQTGFVM